MSRLLRSVRGRRFTMTDIETDPLLGTTSTSDERHRENHVLPATSATGRTIGWTSAYILVISRVIGSGIFAMPGTIVQDVGSPGLALILWVVGALIAWCSLAIDLEFGCMLPRSGGTKVYLEYSFARPRFLASTMIAVAAVLLGFTATNCIVFAKYMLFAAGGELSDSNVKILATGLLISITVVHGCFRQTGIWIQNLLGWLKVGLIIFMIVTGLFVVLLRPNTEVDLRSNSLFDDSDWSLNTLATSTLKIFYSYAGLSNVNNVMNEVKNPIRTLKTVSSSALITACVMYVLINVAYLAVVPLNEVKRSGELIAALFFNRVFGDGLGDVFLPVAIALCAAGNVMVVTFSLARLNQEVARQGFLPLASLLASNKPYGAPLGGLIIHLVPSALVIILPPSASAYAFIADVEGYAGQFFVLAVAIGLLSLRIKEPHLLRPFKAWIPAVWLRIALCLTLIAAPLFPPKKSDVKFFYGAYALVGLAVLLFGVLYWFVWTVAMPHFQSYSLEERSEVVDDGTTVTRLVRVPVEQKSGIE